MTTILPHPYPKTTIMNALRQLFMHNWGSISLIVLIHSPSSKLLFTSLDFFLQLNLPLQVHPVLILTALLLNFRVKSLSCKCLGLGLVMVVFVINLLRFLVIVLCRVLLELLRLILLWLELLKLLELLLWFKLSLLWLLEVDGLVLRVYFSLVVLSWVFSLLFSLHLLDKHGSIFFFLLLFKSLLFVLFQPCFEKGIFCRLILKLLYILLSSIDSTPLSWRQSLHLCLVLLLLILRNLS